MPPATGSGASPAAWWRYRVRNDDGRQDRDAEVDPLAYVPSGDLHRRRLRSTIELQVWLERTDGVRALTDLELLRLIQQFRFQASGAMLGPHDRTWALDFTWSATSSFVAAMASQHSSRGRPAVEPPELVAVDLAGPPEIIRSMRPA